MEKEMKKLLLVAVSVGVFLLVTITAAIVILTPKAQTEETAFSSSRPYPGVRIQSGTESIIDQPQPENSQETNANREDSGISMAVDKNEGDNLTIKIPTPSTAAVPNNPEIKPADSKPAAATASVKSVPAKPAVTSKPAATPKPAAVPKPASARTTNDYWVQTGAFTAKIRAEDVKEVLASKGITSIIENRIVDGKTWYRVRLGPYTSEREANYWLALVKAIDGFGESQVRQTVRQQ